MPEVVSDTYSPVLQVPNGLRESLEAQGKSLSDSLGPSYYPKVPQSNGNDNPMTPLQAPWPHLPPLPNEKEKKTKLPTSVRSFLERQH